MVYNETLGVLDGVKGNTKLHLKQPTLTEASLFITWIIGEYIHHPHYYVGYLWVGVTTNS